MVTFSYDMYRSERISRNLGMITGTLTFDSSYPAGGEDISNAVSGSIGKKFANLLNVTFDGGMGYNCVFDATNDKVKAFANAPAIVFEEEHTASGNLVTLNYPAAWIINVSSGTSKAAGGQNEYMCPVGTTLADHQCALTAKMADDVRTGITTYGSTDCIFVTYVTQAWQDIYHLLVQEEVIAMVTGTFDTEFAIMGFGYAYRTESTAHVLPPMDIADTVASGYLGVDFTVTSGVGTACLDANSNENGKAGVVTYLKKPSSGFISERLIDDENGANTTGVNIFTYPLLLYLITGHVTVDTVDAGEVLIGAGGNPGTNEAHIIWGSRPAHATTGAGAAAQFTIGIADDVSATAIPYLRGYPEEIPNLKQLEVMNGTDLSHLKVRFTAVGTM